MECVTVLHPSEETSVRCERNDREALDVKASLEAVGVHREQAIHQAEELHDALVLPQVFVALQKELVVLAIAALDRQTPGALLRRDDSEFGGEARDLDDRFPALVSTCTPAE